MNWSNIKIKTHSPPSVTEISSNIMVDAIIEPTETVTMKSRLFSSDIERLPKKTDIAYD